MHDELSQADAMLSLICACSQCVNKLPLRNMISVNRSFHIASFTHTVYTLTQKKQLIVQM